MSKIRALLRKCNTIIIKFGNGFSWIYAFIVLISVYEVLMRYAFNSPTVWVHETSVSLAGIAMIYGGLYAYARKKHITVTVVTDLLPSKIQTIFKWFSDVIGLIFLILLTIAAYLITIPSIFAPDGSMRLERSGSAWNSVFPGVMKISMSVFLSAFTLLILVHVIARTVYMVCKNIIDKEDYAELE